MALKLVQTQTLASAVSSISLTSIPQDATDLVIKLSARSATGTQVNCFVTVNSPAGGGRYTYLIGDGTGAGSGASTGFAGLVWGISGGSTTGSTFGNSEMYITNYTSGTTKAASADSASENNATSSGLAITANKWLINDPITSLYFTTDGGNFQIGTVISLYKITKGTSSGVIAS